MKLCYEEKDLGNQAYKSGVVFAQHTKGKNDLSDACAHYAKALGQLEIIYDGSIHEHKELKRDLLLNLAAVGLKVETYEQVMSCCNEILENVDPESSKAFYRRALGFLKLKQFEKAVNDLQAAIVINPRDKQLHKTLESAKQQLSSQQTREKLQRETQLGRQRQLSKARESEIQQVIQNGGQTDRYYWGQTPEEVHLMILDDRFQSSDQIQCEIHRKRIFVQLTAGDVEILVEGNLQQNVQADECYWMLEQKNELHIYLRKEQRPEKGSSESDCWWPCVLQGEPHRLTSTCRGSGDESDYTSETRQKVAQNLQAMVQEAGPGAVSEWQRIKATEKAALEKNPSKKAMAESIRSNFPDVPLIIR